MKKKKLATPPPTSSPPSPNPTKAKRAEIARTPIARIRSTLRRLWMYSNERHAALKRARRCEICHGATDLHVHHAVPINWEAIENILRAELLVPPSRLRVLCAHCHKRVTRAENEKPPPSPPFWRPSDFDWTLIQDAKERRRLELAGVIVSASTLAQWLPIWRQNITRLLESAEKMLHGIGYLPRCFQSIIDNVYASAQLLHKMLFGVELTAEELASFPSLEVEKPFPELTRRAKEAEHEIARVIEKASES